LRVVICAAALAGLTSLASTAHAEWYVAGQLGANVPNRLTETKGTGSLAGSTYTSQNMQVSLAYGAKVGYFFERAKWLGIETEAYNSTPNIKPQAVGVSQPGGTAYPTSAGQNLRVTTWATNLIARYPGETFQPYVGAGVGVFFANMSNSMGSAASNWTPGLNALAGMRAFLTEKVALFGEYKYNYADFQFDNVFNQKRGISARYSANIIVGGLSYHF